MRNLADRAGFAFFLVFLILPTLYFDLTHRVPPWAPRILMPYYSLSNLFQRGVREITIDYLQVRPAEGAPWVTLPQESYFRMKTGYRTRFSRFSDIYLAGGRSLISRFACDELTPWIRRRYSELNPGRPGPAAVRVLQARYRVGSRKRTGRWSNPPLESFPPEDVSVIYESAVHE